MQALSIEHIPPDRLGGKIKTLTCQKCNNDLGSRVDAHLVGRISAEEMKQGKIPIPGVLRVAGQRAAIKTTLVKRAEGTSGFELAIECRPKSSKPGSIESIIETLSSSFSDKFDLAWNLGFKPGPSNSGFLKSAYLMMFYYFGYSYIRYDFVQPLRHAIFNPQSGLELFKGIVRLKKKPPWPNSIAIVTSPMELKGFVVFLEMKDVSEHHWAIFLPGFDGNNELYSNVNRLKGNDISARLVPYTKAYIEKAQGPYVAEQIWRSLTNQVKPDNDDEK